MAAGEIVSGASGGSPTGLTAVGSTLFFTADDGVTGPELWKAEDGAPDTTPPQTTIDTGPANGATTDDTTPTFGFSSSEAGSSFECRVDGGGFSGCTSPATIGPLADGEHTFEVRARDLAGNADPTPAARTFTVEASGEDTTAPNGTVKAKGRNKAGKPVKIKVRSDEDAVVRATGKQKQTKGGKRKITVKLKPVKRSLSAGQAKTQKLKPKGKKQKRQARKLKRKVKRKQAGAKAKIVVTFTDEAGNRSKEKLTIRLK